jgi:hypothetical protein
MLSVAGAGRAAARPAAELRVRSVDEQVSVWSLALGGLAVPAGCASAVLPAAIRRAPDRQVTRGSTPDPSNDRTRSPAKPYPMVTGNIRTHGHGVTLGVVSRELTPAVG